MATVAALTTRRGSRLARWFWSLLLMLIGTVVSITAWNFVFDLITRVPLLGYAVGALMAAFIAVLLAIAVKEISVFSRLKRLDKLHHDASDARGSEDMTAARSVVDQLDQLYKGRADLRWGRERLAEQRKEVFDPGALLDIAESEVLFPLDAAARREVEAAARQVATVTALVPLALADVVGALTANLRMIRRIAEIYGGGRALWAAGVWPVR